MFSSFCKISCFLNMSVFLKKKDLGFQFDFCFPEEEFEQWQWLPSGNPFFGLLLQFVKAEIKYSMSWKETHAFCCTNFIVQSTWFS